VTRAESKPGSGLLLVPTALERERLALVDFGRWKVSLCGMGPVAAAVEVARRLSSEPFAACVLVGLGGSRDLARAPIGSLVVGSLVRNEAVGCGHDHDFVPLGEMAPAGETVPADALDLAAPDGWQASGAGTRLMEGVAVREGALGTVASTSASLDQAGGWARRHPDVLVEEMEGHAVAVACLAADVPLSIVRAVSNEAGDREKSRWDIIGALSALGRALPALLGAGP